MIGIDWGTTGLRSYLIDNGQLVEKRTSTRGVLKLGNQSFREVFDEVTQGWDGTVYMSGMVGSSKGWLETPYIQTPTNLTNLSDHIIDTTSLTGRTSFIIPGLEQNQPADVMRGEEVQTLGAMHGTGSETFILCGTHSKHVHVVNGQLTEFTTFMTGEMYAVLQEHSILAESEVTDLKVFKAGVQFASSRANLLHQLFEIRARRLNGSLTAAPPFLSGLLIGHELQSLSDLTHCTVVGSKALTQLYSVAINVLYPNILVNQFLAEDASIKGYCTIYRNSYV